MVGALPEAGGSGGVDGSGGVVVCVSPASSMRGVCANLQISQPARARSSVDLGTCAQRIQRAMHIMGVKGWRAEVDFTLRSTTIAIGWGII